MIHEEREEVKILGEKKAERMKAKEESRRHERGEERTGSGKPGGDWKGSRGHSAGAGQRRGSKEAPTGTDGNPQTGHAVKSGRKQ